MASVSRIALLATTALTADNTGTTNVLEGLSTDFIAYLRVSVNDGATTVDAKIQHSADGTNWVDKQAFTSVVNTTSTQGISLSGGLLPYVRSYVDLTGTPAATVEVALYYDKRR